MNRKEHFEKYKNTEQKIMEEPSLAKWIIIIKDEDMSEKEISSTLIRELINKKDYQSLQGMLSKESIQYHIDNNIQYSIQKNLKKEELLVKIEDIVEDK